MKEITKYMVRKFRITKIGYDFMGYTFVSPTELSFHHVVEREDGGEETFENGLILVRKTAHDYIHIIQKHSKETYDKITREMLKEKEKFKIDIENIKSINELLLEFEYKHRDDTFKDGTLIIRDIYKERFLNHVDKNML